MKTYVGIKHLNTDTTSNRVIFKNQADPVRGEYEQFIYVIGPFKTLRGAKFMRDFGFNNPHCQDVNDAEKLAKLNS